MVQAPLPEVLPVLLLLLVLVLVLVLDLRIRPSSALNLGH
jgi:hypothetical protein